MDTSKQYIEMCYTKEIQELSQRETGDYYYQIKDDGETCKGIFICWNGYKPNAGYHNWNNDWYFPENCIWLPTQAQLQKMLDCETYELLDMCSESDGIMWQALHDYANSMEQLWLAFVMKEKYQKTWNGKEWVK